MVNFHLCSRSITTSEVMLLYGRNRALLRHQLLPTFEWNV